MERVAVHRLLAVAAGIVAAGAVAAVLPQPIPAAVAGVLWSLGVAGVLRGYRTFPEWAGDVGISRVGFLLGVGAIAAAKGVVVFAFAYLSLAAPLGDAAWMSVALAAVVLLAAGIGVTFLVEESAAEGEEATV